MGKPNVSEPSPWQHSPARSSGRQKQVRAAWCEVGPAPGSPKPAPSVRGRSSCLPCKGLVKWGWTLGFDSRDWKWVLLFSVLLQQCLTCCSKAAVAGNVLSTPKSHSDCLPCPEHCLDTAESSCNPALFHRAPLTCFNLGLAFVHILRLH